MATETRRAKRQHAGIAILDQLADLDVRSISPETAQTLLKLRFDEFHHERFNLLTAKAREASLTPSEQADLDEYIQTGGYPGDRAVQSPPGPQERWRGCSVTVHLPVAWPATSGAHSHGSSDDSGTGDQRFPGGRAPS